MKYPRVLVLAMSRINAADADSNGLLLPNLFGSWRRKNLGQIYGSADNADEGLFGHCH
jgi:hypothetical protein